MNRPLAVVGRRLIPLVAAALTACADRAPLAPEPPSAIVASAAPSPAAIENQEIALLRQVTARYHDLDAAIADGFVFLHSCEVRAEEEEEGPVGIVYINLSRLLDGVVDPSLPDGLIYEPRRVGEPKLVGVEFAVPYPLWPSPQPPTFQGATFQREDEFGVFGLHVWLWRNNTEGLFAESNPNVSCGEEE